MQALGTFDRRKFLALTATGLTASAVQPSERDRRGVLPGDAGHELAPGSVLEAGGRRTSPDGRFILSLQSDGNLVWMDRGRSVLWNAGTCGAKSVRCHMQPDGNLVVYGARGDTPEPLWSSRTDGHGGARLVCQSDGNLVIYRGSEAVWASNTEMAQIAAASAHVQVKDRWGADHLYEFLNALPKASILALKQSLGLLYPEDGVDQLKGKSQDVRDIQRQALWLSSSVFAYPFRDSAALDYHKMVDWVAGEVGVVRTPADGAGTFATEREIQKQLFAQLWDKLSGDRRAELLGRIDPNGAIKDHAAVVLQGGASALAALAATVAFSGFQFYVTMSVTISAVAGFLGLTLPFVAYTSAASLVAFLCGPVGWAIIGLAALGGLALAGRPSVKETTALVCQLHSLKIASLLAAEVPESGVFQQ